MDNVQEMEMPIRKKFSGNLVCGTSKVGPYVIINSIISSNSTTTTTTTTTAPASNSDNVLKLMATKTAKL
jgi:hypothetical protein